MNEPVQKLIKSLKYVSVSNGRIVYRPKIASANRHLIETDKNGFVKPVRLGTVKTATADAVMTGYLAAKRSIEARIGEQRNTLKWVVEQYMQSRQFKSLVITSQKNAGFLAKILDHRITVNGKDSTFGDLSVSVITKPTVRRLAEKRLQDFINNGKKGTVAVNRQITFLSTAWNWAAEHIDGLNVTANPFTISKFKETPNARYVNDDEYRIQLDFAKERNSYFAVLFELTYLLAARGIEVINIKLSDIDPDRVTGGIVVDRRKGSKTTVIEWSDRLYNAFLQAKTLHAKHRVQSINAPLILGEHGQALTRTAVSTAMQRLKKSMQDAGLGGVYWSLHNLKRKGITDSVDKKIGGHRSEAVRDIYDLSTERFKPPR